jgi:hypothetical protein
MRSSDALSRKVSNQGRVTIREPCESQQGRIEYISY